jgi:lactobin A/cerein 7B family class IIb bacteriocin
MKQSTVRELSDEEIQLVSGGIAPLIGLAASVVGHFTARTVLTSFASRIGLGGSIFGAAAYFSDK